MTSLLPHEWSGLNGRMVTSKCTCGFPSPLSCIHKIRNVFQNARDGELNLLFTGDAQPEHLKMIAENYDGKLPLYEHYWCIKVPHHGTQGHGTPANFALEPETVPPCQRLPPRGSWQSRRL